MKQSISTIEQINDNPFIINQESNQYNIQETNKQHKNVSVHHNLFSPEFDTCKKHPNKMCCYSTIEEPWLRFCQQCALNVALSGKQIYKKISQEQMGKKLQIQNMVVEIKKYKKLNDQKETKFKNELELIQKKSVREVQSLISFYDQNIQQLTQQKAIIQKLYAQRLINCDNELFMIKQQISKTSRMLKHLQQKASQIFAAVMENQNSLNFDQQMQSYRKILVENIKKLLDNKQQVAFIEKKKECQSITNQITQIYYEFYQKYVEQLSKNFYSEKLNFKEKNMLHLDIKLSDCKKKLLVQNVHISNKISKKPNQIYNTQNLTYKKKKKIILSAQQNRTMAKDFNVQYINNKY